MTMSGRERAIGAITLMVVLYGVLGLLAKGRLEAWRSKRGEFRQACILLDQQRKLIAQRPLWQKNYAGVQALMPVFPADKPVDTHWLGVMDNAATGNQLNILKRQVGTEQLVGDVYEMAIDCREWEGSLDALVHFLYGLESAGVMLDMREMYIRPSPADHSRLKGSFKLYCAYMRERPVPVTQTPEAGARKPAAGVQKPAPATRKPTADGQKPAPVTRKPAPAPAAPARQTPPQKQPGQ
ncbi:MAG: hypothetical protein ACOYOU_16665 [Kiritimatiellia bacterium]